MQAALTLHVLEFWMLTNDIPAVPPPASGGLSSNLRAFAGGPLSFALPLVGQRRSSLVTLEVPASSLRLITNTSPGRITSA